MPADFHLKAVASSIVRQNQAWRHIVGEGLPSKGSTCRSIDLTDEFRTCTCRYCSISVIIDLQTKVRSHKSILHLKMLMFIVHCYS